MSAVFGDMDGVLDEAAAMAGEAQEANRSETARLKSEIAEADKFVGNLTRLLADPDIEAGAKKAVARQLAEQGRNCGWPWRPWRCGPWPTRTDSWPSAAGRSWRPRPTSRG